MSFIFSLVTLGILIIFYSVFGWLSTLPYILDVAGLFLFVPVINYWGNHRIGRMLFCLIPVWLTMFVTLYFKLVEDPQTYILYFDSRFILMATPILPGIVFRLEEKAQLFICMGSSVVAMLLYDPIHELFGAGYFQKGFNDPSYYYISYISAVAFIVLIVGIFLLRSLMEQSEANLANHNRELSAKQHEVEAHHEELLQHQEEILSSREKLEAANALILKQRETLERYNTRLEAIVTKKSEELRRTNEELIKHNNELLQFSYTVSHNLRGPVARLLGLTRLFKVTEGVEERKQLDELVVQSSQELDTVLKDLSLIIDIRNEIYRVREKVYLEEELKRAMAMLGENIRPDYQFDVNFSGSPYIFGVRPMIQSIFFNLLSNAIKYQSPDRPLKVSVSSRSISSVKTVVEISDNGLGIDLKTQDKNIFKLYKRFHAHIPGKGLGLYLVKTQVEALGGKIDVQSAPDRGTSFRIVFTQPEEVSRQVFHENDAVQLYYDGNLNITVIQWKRQVTSEEYRKTFAVILDSLKVYKTPGWISDVRKQGFVSDEDQLWLLNTLAVDAIKSGLKQIAMIGFNDAQKEKYYGRIKKVSSQNNIRLHVCDSMEEALQWMKDTLT
jgi:signal transduction histidine kinase